MPVDPRHLTAFAELVDTAFAAVADAEAAVDAAARELVGQGAHPSICGNAFRVRDHLRHALGLVGAATGRLDVLRHAYAPVAAPVAAAALAAVPTDGERTGGVYIGRQRAAQAAAGGF